MAEHIRILVFDHNVSQTGSLNFKMNQRPKIIPVCKRLTELFRKGRDTNASDRIHRKRHFFIFSVIIRKSIRKECCYLTLCFFIAAEGTDRNTRLLRSKAMYHMKFIQIQEIRKHGNFPIIGCSCQILQPLSELYFLFFHLRSLSEQKERQKLRLKSPGNHRKFPHWLVSG